MAIARDGFGRPVPVPSRISDPIQMGSETDPTGSLLLWISGKPYSLIIIPDHPDCEASIQFRLTKVGGESYQVAVDLDGHASCECAAFVYSREVPGPKSCKHTGALKNSGLLNLTWKKGKP